MNNDQDRGQMGWEGGLREKGRMYTYEWLMLMYGRNQHNIVKHFILQSKINFKQ